MRDLSLFSHLFCFLLLLNRSRGWLFGGQSRFLAVVDLIAQTQGHALALGSDPDVAGHDGVSLRRVLSPS